MNHNNNHQILLKEQQTMSAESANDYKYNRFMPQFVKDTIHDEAIEWKQQFMTGFKKAIISDDIIDWACAMSAVRIFHRYASSLCYPLNDEDRVKICELILPLLLHPTCSSDNQSRLANALNCALKNDMTSREETREPLSKLFEWKPFYQILHRFYFRKYRSLLYTPLESHKKALISLIVRMRRFFGPEVTDQVWNEFRPLMCPHDHMSNQAQGFLCLFLPTNNGRAEWLPEVLEMWLWNDNNPYWDFNFFYLLRRLAQDSVSLVDWKPHLELIFTRVLRSIDLPVGTSRVLYNRFPSQACSLFSGNFNQIKYALMEHCANLIVWMISPQCPETMHYLKKIV